jgi:hypothetical protein
VESSLLVVVLLAVVRGFHVKLFNFTVWLKRSFSEYAGEIKDAFPGKKVTIVHSDALLLNSTYPNKYRKRAEEDFTTHEVDIIFNDYVDNLDTLHIKTRSGRSGGSRDRGSHRTEARL